MSATEEAELLLLAGSYTRSMPDAQGRGEGIYSCWFNTASGELRLASVFRGIADPAYLAVDAANRRVYAISRQAENTDGNDSALCALDAGTGGRDADHDELPACARQGRLLRLDDGH